MWLFIIDLIDEKITEKEKEDMREILQKITKGKKEKGKIMLVKKIHLFYN
jgi:hypothetical protein